MLQPEDSDNDTCDGAELDQLFTIKCQLLAEQEVALDQAYILHITGTLETNCNVAIGTSNNLCEVYQFSNNQLAKLETLGEDSGAIVGVQFSIDNSNLLYSGTVNGNIKLWDLRLPKKLVAQFTDTTVEKSEKLKPITCFDVSSNNRLLAAGTELYEGEAFVLFWDVRNVKLLGGYWESHTDDITQIKFHPNDVNTLISGSTDGLINTYDLTQTAEDDALLDSLNTESSIEQLMWYKYKGKDCICCITHTSDIQLWQIDGAAPYAHFRRSLIGNKIRRKSEAHCYVVSAHRCSNDDLFVLSGSNWNDGECVRALQVNNTNLAPMFTLKENKQRIRSSWYNLYHNVLVTGGERGILNAWRVNVTA